MDRLKALRVFVRVVELGSFSGAARDLSERQASVSRWVAGLEDELGVQLIERTTRAVRVNAAGRRFYDEAKRVLDAWQNAQERARDHRTDVRGELRVSLPVVFGARFISPHVPGFLARYPEAAVELVFTDRYVDLVEDRVDVALRVGQPVDVDYKARVLGATDRCLVASPSFVERWGKIESLERLEVVPCLLHSGLNNKVVWRFSCDGVTRAVKVGGTFASNHSDTLLMAAKAGCGVALLAEWLVGDALRTGELLRILPDHEAPRASIQALYAATRRPSRLVEAWLDFCQDRVSSMLEE